MVGISTCSSRGLQSSSTTALLTCDVLPLCSCGAMTHKTKDCVERPRKVGARWSNKHIAADEKVEQIDMKGFEAKRDRWTGYDSKEYSRVIDT